jgi:hypothetical protein
MHAEAIQKTGLERKVLSEHEVANKSAGSLFLTMFDRMTVNYFPVLQVLTLLQAIFNTKTKQKNSLKRYKGLQCYAETRWELGAVLLIVWPLMLEEVAARNRD